MWGLEEAYSRTDRVQAPANQNRWQTKNGGLFELVLTNWIPALPAGITWCLCTQETSFDIQCKTIRCPSGPRASKGVDFAFWGLFGNAWGRFGVGGGGWLVEARDPGSLPSPTGRSCLAPHVDGGDSEKSRFR